MASVWQSVGQRLGLPTLALFQCYFHCNTFSSYNKTTIKINTVLINRLFNLKDECLFSFIDYIVFVCGAVCFVLCMVFA